jgi:hypothetical protein
VRNPCAGATFLTSSPESSHCVASFQPFLLRRNMAQKRHFQIAGKPGIG